MKRNEILAAIAAAAGLAFTAPAQASVMSNLPKTETLQILQQQVSDQSDEALSQMIHLAKAKGERSGKGSKGGKASERGEHQDNGNHKGHDKGKGYSEHGKGKGKGHGHHNHPS